MPKRRKTKVSESEDDWEAEADGGSEESAFSDASFKQKTRKTRVPSQKEAPRKRQKVVPLAPSDSDICPTPTITKPHSYSLHTITKAEDIRSDLLRWYQAVRDSRGMPWRKPFNTHHTHAQRAQRAYEVWISEIMLQQTQVATVIPYYNRWMAKFPTISDLAAGTIDEVNALWKGLGYYSRASRLLAGAQKAVSELGGQLPNNAKDMEAKIPGIGRYSAGAICSIAYGEKVPVLDGNVHRLLSRFLRLHANPKGKATLDILWAAAEAMVQVGGSPNDDGYQNPGDVNQALIELGSTVCRVRDPLCSSCPLSTRCWANQLVTLQTSKPGSQDAADIEEVCSVCEPITGEIDVTSFPMKVEKKKAREEVDIVNVIEWRRSSDAEERWFLLVKRPKKGLLAGLEEFPTLSNTSDSLSREQLDKIPYDLLSEILETPISVADPSSPGQSDHTQQNRSSRVRFVRTVFVGDVLHIFSHIRKTYRTQWVVLEGGDSPPAVRKCVQPGVQQKGAGKTHKKQKSSNTIKGEGSFQILDAKWVLLDDVAHENTGTGVVKVWKLTRSLWSKDSS